MMDLICCPSHHLPNYLTITSSASISIIWQQLHNIILFLASMETTLLGRAGRGGGLAVVTFSLLVTKIYRAGPGNKTRQKCLSFLPHPLLSNLSLHSCHLLCNFSSEVLKLKIYNSIYRNLFHLEIYTQYPILYCDHWAFKDNSIKS